MTTPILPSVRLVMSGRISTVQSWSTGISMLVGGGGLTQANLDALLSRFQTAANLFWIPASGFGLADYNTSAVDLRSVRAYLYPAGPGPAALSSGADFAPVAGRSTTNRHPTQCALVASLLTGLPGRNRRGRMYLPFTANTLNADHQVPQTDIQALSNAVKALIDYMNQAAITGVSRTAIVGPTAATPVTSIRVDSEVDIQRRRADKILAARTATAAVAP